MAWLAAPAGAFHPSTDGLDELSNIERLAVLREGVQCRMESSYDRTGGNNDGFNGTYSRLRAEGGDSVLAEIEGPGRIQRFWMTYSLHHETFLLNGKNEHIRFYLDGEETPRIDLPIHDLFNGTNPAFPRPLVGEGTGGFYCYVPITFTKGCKVVVEGEGAKFWHLTYNTFDSADGLTTFSMERSAAQQKQLDAAVQAWSNPSDPKALGVRGRDTHRIALSLEAGEAEEFELPDGPHVIRAIELTGDPDSITKASDARVALYWDGADQPAVDLPLSYLFGDSARGATFESLVMGAKPDRRYCYLPMPYGKSARLVIHAKDAFAANLEINAHPVDAGDDTEWGYFHGLWRQEFPTTPGKQYPWLAIEQGRGHYVGIVLDTQGLGPQGDNWLPLWLEGDETFRVNGELLIHGTGTEDYFNCGWYAVPGRLNEPGNYPLHGYPAFVIGPPTTYATSYRWHLTDPVPFDGSIRAQIESGPTSNISANYQSAVFYYLDQP